MQIHRGVLEQIDNSILPFALRVNGLDLPYPAEFWVDGEVQYEDSTAIFRIKDGSLVVEFFIEGVMSDYSYLIPGEKAVVLKGTQIKVPVLSCRPNEKTRTIYAGKRVWQQGYECAIQGWLGGDGNSQMRCAILTIANLPRLSLPKEGLMLNAGDWVITLRPYSTYLNKESAFLHYAEIIRKDGEPFTLSDSDLNSGIIAALHDFLSFQCGYWVDFPTIVCHPPHEELSERASRPPHDLDTRDGDRLHIVLTEAPEESLVERAWIGRLISKSPDSPSQALVATDESGWGALMPEFWRLYDDPYLKHSVKYYVQSSRLLYIDLEYAFVAMRSTLEALIRWWCDFSGNDRLEGKAFINGLKNAIREADLGLDNGKRVDVEKVGQPFTKVINQYRNNIAHAHRLSEPLIGRTIADGHGFQWHIARMLILAKLGHRNIDSRGRFGLPLFVERNAD